MSTASTNGPDTQNPWLPRRTSSESDMRNAIFDPVFCQGKTRVSRRARESAHFSDVEPLSSQFASRRWFLPSQNQTSIRCLGPEGRHRRLSVCSLPVLKQSEGSLGSFISVVQSVSGGTWQSARCVILVLSRRRRSAFRKN